MTIQDAVEVLREYITDMQNRDGDRWAYGNSALKALSVISPDMEAITPEDRAGYWRVRFAELMEENKQLRTELLSKEAALELWTEDSKKKAERLDSIPIAALTRIVREVEKSTLFVQTRDLQDCLDWLNKQPATPRR